MLSQSLQPSLSVLNPLSDQQATTDVSTARAVCWDLLAASNGLLELRSNWLPVPPGKA